METSTKPLRAGDAQLPHDLLGRLEAAEHSRGTRWAGEPAEGVQGPPVTQRG